MATSGSRSFLQTLDSIVSASLRKLGVIIQGESYTTTQFNEAVNALNSMIQSWQSRGVFLWSIENTYVQVSKSVNQYTILRALEVLQANLLDSSNTVYPLKFLTREEYFSITDKNRESLPNSIYISYGINDATVSLYPTPDNSYTLSCARVVKLQDFVSTDNNPDFPVYWSDAIIYGLAHRLSAEYGIPLQERQMLLAESTALFNEALAYSREKGNIQFGVYR